MESGYILQNLKSPASHLKTLKNQRHNLLNFVKKLPALPRDGDEPVGPGLCQA
jgi:hypothetical protein